MNRLPTRGAGLLLLFFFGAGPISFLAAAPANDAFSAASLLVGNAGAQFGSNSGASKESGEPAHAGSQSTHSVWYSWTATNEAPVTFETVVSDFDTLLAVYTGTSVNNLTPVASNDDILDGRNHQSRVRFTPAVATTYRIAVDGRAGETGAIYLRWEQRMNLPDMIVYGPTLVPAISVQTFSPGSCAVQEGLIVAGERKLVRFATESRNIGNADLHLGDPSGNPLFEFATCHGHYHLHDYVAHRLKLGETQVAAGGKVGHCLLDSGRWRARANATAKYGCGNQGIQAGWFDVYRSTLDGQWVDITGVPPGTYTLEVEINPERIFEEDAYTNNVAQVELVIPDEPRTVPVTFIPPGSVAGPNSHVGVVIDTSVAHVVAGSLLLTFDHAVIPNPQMTQDGSHLTVLVPNPPPLVLGSSHVIDFSYTDTLVGPESFSHHFVIALFFEDFEQLTLGPNVEEELSGTAVWTNRPPLGWTQDNQGVPGFTDPSNNGVKEWAGWSFASKDWWAQTAQDQTRSSFTKGFGTVAIADPDEWDDAPHPVGLYNTFLTTPPISLAGIAAKTAVLTFDSSWRPECCDDNANLANDQTATVTVSFDGGPHIEKLRWTSTSGSPFFHPDAQDESISIPLDNPAGVGTVRITFGLSKAENDWWWAIDNIGISAGAPMLQPPIIIAQPQNVTVSVGSQAALSVTTQGGVPQTYQWFQNELPLSNANADTLVLNPAQSSHTGGYTVVVANSDGSVTSRVAEVVVFGGPITQDLVAHLTFDNTFIDSSGRSNHGHAVGTVPFVPGQVGTHAVSFTTAQNGSSFNYVGLGAPTDLNFGDIQDFSIALWIKFDNWVGDPAFVSNKDWLSGGNRGYVLATAPNGGFQWNFAGPPGTRQDYDGPAHTIDDGRWHHVIVTVDRDQNTDTYIDGALVDSRYTANIPNDVSTPLDTNIGQDGTGSYTYAGMAGITNACIDDIGFWRRLVTTEEVQAIYATGLEGKDLSQASAIALGDLTVSLIGQSIHLSWRGGAGIKVQTTIQLSNSDSWMDLPNTEGNSTATVPLTSGSAFFRLVRP